jgi:DNA-binding transcriptional MerR regulator
MPKSNQEPRWTLAELVEESGVSGRTIRYYIARGLLARPLAAGRGASYGEKHLDRLAKIRDLQARGLTLAEIAWELDASMREANLPQPRSWWSYEVAEDVVVWVRSETAPWRLKLVRALTSQMAAQLKSSEQEEG